MPRPAMPWSDRRTPPGGNCAPKLWRLDGASRKSEARNMLRRTDAHIAGYGARPSRRTVYTAPSELASTV